MVARVARRTALMTPSPLVSVEGRLARPRVAPLDGVPPFGGEWTFRGVAGARLGKHCLATLTTSCIDVDAPHRACRWQPLSTTRPSSADLPATPPTPAVLPRPGYRPYPRQHDRRAIHAACWSIGALGIIGWLIVAHEPFADFTAAPALHASGIMLEHATQSAGEVRVAAAPPVAPPLAAAPHTAPVATPARTSTPRGTAPDAQRVASASTPPPHRPSGARTTTARVRAPASSPAADSRLAARPPVTHLASRASHDDPLDNPLTLIALANTLNAERPARATNAPAADFDWTAQLSHRRVTDTFTR
ncbi:hypothetical protein [Burkholderia anthina]|uniref:hypothetical protein n=1 Tax=Burkholderia anthina TaxID=179879 RepID=UPI001FC82169|nr:hypothetical protein [Burkholderia anthina]